MQKLSVILIMLLFSNSAFAGSCPMMAKKVEEKISSAQKLYEEGVNAHSMGNHGESEKLLKEALDLFKN
ncbi:hypothetical protein N9U81_01145 [Candidatus Pelagibacter sp.]|nr:hypothetical protein [Candidatus Pelagibacter sp.]